MRKLLCLLSAALLLFSCNDVDEFGQLLPDSVTLDTQDGLRAISDLTYEELETLVPDEGQREEMRRNGGLLVRPTVVTSLDQQRYDNMYVYYSSSEAGLPPYEDGYGYGDILTGSVDGYNEMAYISWYGEEQRQYLPGTTIYCKVGLSLWDGEQMPGFIDEVKDENYYNRTLYSEVHSYRYPDAAVISEFYLYEGDFIQGSFRVTPKISAASELPECGLCYSATNPLPTVDTDAVVEVSENYWDGMAYNVSAIIQDTAGTYYVRAFVRGESGEVSYSPVRRASCQGLMVSTQVDSIVNIHNLSYGDLSRYLPMATEEQIETLRGEAGYLIYASSQVETGYEQYRDFGFTVFPDEDVVRNWDGYSESPFYYENDGDKFVYHLAAGAFVEDSTWYYRSTVAVSTNMIWIHSGVKSISWESNIPVVVIGSYISDGFTFDISFRTHSWGQIAHSGICYSTTNDSPTLEQNDGIVEYSDVSETTFDSHIVMKDIALPAGIYYVRAYSQTEEGVGYSSVIRTNIRAY